MSVQTGEIRLVKEHAPHFGNGQDGYGAIKPDDGSALIFFNLKAVGVEAKRLQAGQQVTYVTEPAPQTRQGVRVTQLTPCGS